MLLSQPRVRRGDAGFTLIELLITISVLGIIIVPLTGLILGVFTRHKSTDDRMRLSHDKQITSSYFATDASTMGVRDPADPKVITAAVQTGAAYNDTYTCGTAATPRAVIRFVGDAWESPTSSVKRVVSYHLVGTELRRLTCRDGVSASETTLARHVRADSVRITCDTTTPCPAKAVPKTVELSFKVEIKNGDKPADHGEDTITVNAQRRQT